jgi:serine protease Do
MMDSNSDSYKFNQDDWYKKESVIQFDSIFNQEEKTTAPPDPAAGLTEPIASEPEAIAADIIPPEQKIISSYSMPATSMPAPSIPVNAIPAKPTPAKRTGWGKKTAAACLVAVLGCGTLGLGLGAGNAIANRFFIETPAEAEAEEAFSFADSASAGLSTAAPIAPAADFSIPTNNVTSIVKKVSDAVVSINVSAQVQSFFNQVQEQQGAGSGIIFSEDTEKVYIATNNHVIEGADKVTISMDDKKQIPAKFVGSDPQSDLAVISVAKEDMSSADVSYKLADFGDSASLQVGDEVVAIGNAMGEGKTATSGIISGINKQITIDGKTLAVIQTDAAINPGNSGGALANTSGEIIGINTAKWSSSGVEGMGYSIPSNEAKKIIEDLMTNGSVQKPYLGIQGMSITEQMRDMYNLPSVGVYVAEVTPGGGAEAAGLQASDIIVGYQPVNSEASTKITTLDELSGAISKSKVGDTVTIYIFRRTIPMELQAVIGDMNSDTNF